MPRSHQTATSSFDQTNEQKRTDNGLSLHHTNAIDDLETVRTARFWLFSSSLSISMREKLVKIETRTISDIHILDCSGEKALGQGTMAVRNSVGDILKIDGKKIVPFRSHLPCGGKVL